MKARWLLPVASSLLIFAIAWYFGGDRWGRRGRSRVSEAGVVVQAPGWIGELTAVSGRGVEVEVCLGLASHGSQSPVTIVDSEGVAISGAVVRGFDVGTNAAREPWTLEDEALERALEQRAFEQRERVLVAARGFLIEHFSWSQFQNCEQIILKSSPSFTILDFDSFAKESVVIELGYEDRGLNCPVSLVHFDDLLQRLHNRDRTTILKSRRDPSFRIVSALRMISLDESSGYSDFWVPIPGSYSVKLFSVDGERSRGFESVVDFDHDSGHVKMHASELVGGVIEGRLRLSEDLAKSLRQVACQLERIDPRTGVVYETDRDPVRIDETGAFRVFGLADGDYSLTFTGQGQTVALAYELQVSLHESQRHLRLEDLPLDPESLEVEVRQGSRDSRACRVGFLLRDPDPVRHHPRSELSLSLPVPHGRIVKLLHNSTSAIDVIVGVSDTPAFYKLIGRAEPGQRFLSFDVPEQARLISLFKAEGDPSDECWVVNEDGFVVFSESFESGAVALPLPPGNYWIYGIAGRRPPVFTRPTSVINAQITNETESLKLRLVTSDVDCGCVIRTFSLSGEVPGTNGRVLPRLHMPVRFRGRGVQYLDGTWPLSQRDHTLYLPPRSSMYLELANATINGEDVVLLSSEGSSETVILNVQPK